MFTFTFKPPLFLFLSKPHLTHFLHSQPADRNPALEQTPSTCAQAAPAVFGHQGLAEQVYLLLVKRNQSNKAAGSCPLIPPSYRPTSVRIVPSPAFCPGNPYLALPGERAACLPPDHCHLDMKESQGEIQKSSRKRGQIPVAPAQGGHRSLGLPQQCQTCDSVTHSITPLVATTSTIEGSLLSLEQRCWGLKAWRIMESFSTSPALG